MRRLCGFSLVGALAFSACAVAVFGTAQAVAAEPAVASADAEFFEKSVRPLLASKCHQCHGEKKQEFGLRLDSKDALAKGGDGGPVVIAGKPDDSPLIEAVRYEGSIKMPPSGKLDAAEIAVLTEWVRRGAAWPATLPAKSNATIEQAARSHWAFQPIRRPPLPAVGNASWPKSPIDAFILARLEKENLAPSPEADRRTLLRRVSFDLVGLPPTPEEASEFLADDRPDAYEQLVERLLASPRYGERWARVWLDVARFADTKGYVFFEDVKFPWAWTYRDYVIRAFNDDLPYDQFLREQLAGDLIEGAEPQSLAGLGFLTAGNRFMNNQHDILDDRIDVVARGVLGLTVGCARCHDHKFDPIPSADYYSLYGVFRSAREPLVPPLLSAPPKTDEYRKYDDELWRRLQRMDEFVSLKFNGIVGGARTRVAEYLMAAHAVRNQPSTENFMLITDKGDLNPTMNTRWQKYLEEAKRSNHPVWIPWHALGAVDDPPTATTGGAAAANSTFAERAATVITKLEAGTDPPVRIHPLVRAAFVGKPVPQSMQEVAARYGALFADIERQWTSLSAVAESPDPATTPAAPTRLEDNDAEELRQVLYGPDAPANLPRLLGWGFLSLLPDRASQDEFKKLLKEIETWAATGPGAPPRAMALLDEAVPYDPRVFLRGNPNRLGPEIPRWAPGIVDPNRKPFPKGSGRLELAKVLTSPTNPLTARVLANRLWLHHFGAGLVPTAGDFGLRSDPPSHPELLDYLSAEIADFGLRIADSESLGGLKQRKPSTPASNPQSAIRNPQSWSLKHLHRQIVTSAVYRQASSVPRPSTLDTRPSSDPENRLLGRMNRRRLDFESLRDALVAVTGNIDQTIGGPSVAILGTFSPRRTLYGYIDRQDIPSLYRDFDFPDPAASSPQREATTVPPQALFLMNNAFAHAAAQQVIARRDVQSLGPLDAKLDRVSQILFARPMPDSERMLAHEYLGAAPNSDRWFRYIHALLLSNEFAFID